jgi:hypothetical protein
MRVERKPVIFIFIAAVSSVIGIACLMPAGIVDIAAAQTKTVNDPPLLDFETEIRQVKSAERKKRDARYEVETPEFIKNIEASDPSRIMELPPGVDMLPMNAHFWQGLPAIPARQSDIIVIGEVTAAAAHLTDDRNGIYSEFSISVREVFKTADKKIQDGKVIDLSRWGGAVRFASGKVQRYTIHSQGSPEIGSAYLFFLKSEKDNLSILTGYDVSSDRITPLDGEHGPNPMSDLPFAKYRDAAKSGLLADLKTALSSKKED